MSDQTDRHYFEVRAEEARRRADEYGDGPLAKIHGDFAREYARKAELLTQRSEESADPDASVGNI